MTPTPQDAPLDFRLKARLGPEIVALLLVVALAAVVAIVMLTGRGSVAVGPSPLPSTAIVPSASAVAPSPTPPRVPALAVLESVDRLLGIRADLENELEADTTDTVAIVGRLTDLNVVLNGMAGSLAELTTHPASAPLAARIAEISGTTSETIRRTQRISIQNDKAYRDGAADVVAELEPLTAIRPELADLAGASPAPG